MNWVRADRLEVGKVYSMKRGDRDGYEKVMLLSLPNPDLPPPRNKRIAIRKFREGDPEDQPMGIDTFTSTDTLFVEEEDVEMGAARRRRTTRKRKTAHKKRKTVSKRK